MKIQCIDNKTFEIKNGNKNLGYLMYDSLFSLAAKAAIGSIDYSIVPKGVFGTEISVVRGDSEIATMKMNWKGSIILSFKNHEVYILKPTGTFMSKYAIEDKDKNRIMVLDPIINWAKLNYNYTVFSEHTPDVLLVLLATYVTNYYIAVMTAVL